MTVESLINSLTSWVKDGHLSMDSNVYLTESNFPFEEARLFSTIFCGMSEPFYDKKNPTRQCIVLCGNERIPRIVIDDEEWGLLKDYGEFVIKGKHTKEEEDEIIRKADFKCLKRILDEYEKEEDESKKDSQS